MNNQKIRRPINYTNNLWDNLLSCILVEGGGFMSYIAAHHQVAIKIYLGSCVVSLYIQTMLTWVVKTCCSTTDVCA